MDKSKLAFRPNFGQIVSTTSNLLKKTRDGANTLERRVFELLDEQVTNRLLSQYDKLIKAGLTEQEALDAIIRLVRNRLETAMKARRKS